MTRCLVIIASLVLSGVTAAADQSVLVTPRDGFLKPVANLKDGIDLTEIYLKVAEENGFVKNEYTIGMARIEPSAFNIQIRYSERGTSVQATSELLLQQGSRDFVVMTGGFLDSYAPIRPAGYVRVDQSTRSFAKYPAMDPILSGFACIDRDGNLVLRALPTSNSFESETKDYISCIQAGPLLVQRSQRYLTPEDSQTDGNVLRFVKESYHRVFLAKSANHVILGFSTPASLEDLTNATLPKGVLASLGIEDLLNLQGSKNAALLVFVNGKMVYGRGAPTAPQSTVIVATRRKSEGAKRK